MQYCKNMPFKNVNCFVKLGVEKMKCSKDEIPGAHCPNKGSSRYWMSNILAGHICKIGVPIIVNNNVNIRFEDAAAKLMRLFAILCSSKMRCRHSPKQKHKTWTYAHARKGICVSEIFMFYIPCRTAMGGDPTPTLKYCVRLQHLLCHCVWKRIPIRKGLHLQ